MPDLEDTYDVLGIRVYTGASKDSVIKEVLNALEYKEE